MAFLQEFWFGFSGLFLLIYENSVAIARALGAVVGVILALAVSVGACLFVAFLISREERK